METKSISKRKLRDIGRHYVAAHVALSRIWRALDTKIYDREIVRDWREFTIVIHRNFSDDRWVEASIFGNFSRDLPAIPSTDDYGWDRTMRPLTFQEWIIISGDAKRCWRDMVSIASILADPDDMDPHDLWMSLADDVARMRRALEPMIRAQLTTSQADRVLYSDIPVEITAVAA